MLGLSTRGSRKGRPRPSLPKRGRAPPLPSLSTSLARRRRAPRWRGCARSTSAPSPRCLRPPRRHRCRRRGPRRGYGAATSTCGSTTRSSRSWSRETRSEPSPSTGRRSGCVHGSLRGVQGQSEREREGKNLEKLKNSLSPLSFFVLSALIPLPLPQVIPHSKFTFAKLWILAAQVHVRRKDLPSARRLLGQALGRCPKPKLFASYIDLEMGLGEVDRARTLYSKLVEWDPESCAAWSRFAGLEAGLGEAARARALLELAVAQPALDAPELLWKHFIDFEISKRKRRRARALYERLLERTGHVKVWLSFAAFEEAALPEKSGDDDDESDEDDDNDDDEKNDDDDGEQNDDDDRPSLDSPDDESLLAREARSRAVFERAFASLREESPELKEEAVAVLEAWRALEARAAAPCSGEGAGEEGASSSAAAALREERRARVEAKFPRRIKRKRVAAAEGSGGAMEEYYDYVFPGEGAAAAGGGAGGGVAAPSLKLLEAAQAWKRAKLAREQEEREEVANAGGGDDE